jgi:putative transcriptional regulator
LRVVKITNRVYSALQLKEVFMNRIADHRERAGIKQRDLVATLGWTQTRLSNYESGRRVAGLAESRAITAALNQLGVKCSLDDVFPPEMEFKNVA